MTDLVYFPSEIADAVVYREAKLLGEIEITFEGRMISSDTVPADMALPALLFHSTSSVFSGPITQGYSGSLGYETRALCLGLSRDPVREAMVALMARLSGTVHQISVLGVNYAVSFIEIGESIPTNFYQDGTYYQNVGTSWNVQVTRG